MRPAVASAARHFQTLFEGYVGRMYLDGLGLVTTGIGNLIDPAEKALALHWLRQDGQMATLQEIDDEWARVKARQDLRGAPLPKRLAITTLHLADEDIDRLFDSETTRMWDQILSGYPDAEKWPASAQLGALSMAWAMGAGRILPGPAFQYRNFRAAALGQSWGIAAQECKMNGVGVDGRNANNKALFLAAAAGGDPDALPTV